MKKQMLSILIAILAASPAMAIPKPYFIGDAKVENGFMILRDRIACLGYLAPVDAKKRVDPKDLIYPVWNVGLAEAGKTNMMAGAELDGDIVTIAGDLQDGTFNISVQEGKVQEGKLPSYTASTSGTMTEQKGLGLNYSRNGKSGHIGCWFKK